MTNTNFYLAPDLYKPPVCLTSREQVSIQNYRRRFDDESKKTPCIFQTFYFFYKAPFYIFLFLNMIAIITFLAEVVFEELDKRMNKAKSRDYGIPKQFLSKQASLKQIFK